MKSSLLVCLPLLLPFVSEARDEAAPAESGRPNILWVVSEDNNPWLGCYGDPLARTPVLDALARDGIRYVHAHSPAPVCAPTRASIITGRYAPGLGTQHMRSRVPMPPGLRYFPSYLREAGYFCTNRAKTDYNAETLPGTWDENGNQAHWKHRAPGQPFFAVFNLNATHESNLHERRVLQTDPARVRVPAYLPDTPEVRADIAQYHDCINTMDGQAGGLLSELAEAGVAGDTIVFYFADNGGVLPRSKRFLYDNGTHVPLIISFPEKWRRLAPASAGTVSDEMVTLPDLPATVLSLAGVPVPPSFDGRALAGPARAPGPDFVHAFRGRMDEIYDMGRAVIGPRYRYIRNYRPELPAGQRLDYLWRMASMREWERLYHAGELDPAREAFFLPRPPEELYDVNVDPDNVRNLASDPAHRKILERMREANREHLLATRDLGFLPEPMLRALAGERSPEFLGEDEKMYPLAEVLDLLDQLQLPATPPRAALLTAFSSAHAVIRYWAAVVAGQLPGIVLEVEPLLRDADPTVRLAAAVSILRQQDLPAAWEVVDAALQPGRPGEERVTAAHALTLFEGYPGFIRRTLETSPDPSSTLMANYYRRLVSQLLASTQTPKPAREGRKTRVRVAPRKKA
ncbi:MAG: sulfatase-like hydrolase/transferase [Opitutaceae bacterium]